MTANEEGNTEDDRTIFVGGISEKTTEALLYELFFQAGPVSRVSIPKDKETGKIKPFAFVTYKHLSSVDYALGIFSGTKFFGRELQLRNRNRNNSNSSPQMPQRQPPPSLMHGYGGNNALGMDVVNPLQQQLLQLASANPAVLQYASSQMFGTGSNSYASARSDSLGSHREHYVDRPRYHREENRSNRSKPYRRSRSRSPPPRHRDRSPQDYNRGRGGRNSNDKSGYHRWGKR